VERFVERHALKYVHNVSKNVSVVLNGTVLTQTHVNAHFMHVLDLFHRRTRASYVYNGCLAWYNVVLTQRVTQV